MFDECLKKLRKKRMISQKNLSEVLQLSRSTIAQYESGTRAPDFPTLLKIAHYFDVSIDYLLGNESVQQGADPYDQDLFFFYVRDDSMKNARILKGDWAMVQKQNIFNNGEIVLLTMHNKEPFIRRVFLKDHIVGLIPENSDYEVQLANMLEVSILGKVIGVHFV